MTEGAIEVAVRDGRAGRDPALVTPEGGEVLMTYRTNNPPSEADRLTLPDGTEVEVIGITESFAVDGPWLITASVGNIWSAH